MVNPYRTVLIYIFAMFQEVSPFNQDCGHTWCTGGCCAGKCCPTQPEQVFEIPQFFIGTLVFSGVVGFCLLAVTCKKLCKMCKESREPQPQFIRNQPIPLPHISPPGPTTPPVIQASGPPPYSEVVNKPYFYPAPVGQPPCYDNIAMEDLSRELSLQDQHSRIISERPPAPAVISFVH